MVAYKDDLDEERDAGRDLNGEEGSLEVNVGDDIHSSIQEDHDLVAGASSAAGNCGENSVTSWRQLQGNYNLRPPWR